MNHRFRIIALLTSGVLLLQLSGCALEPLQAARASTINTAKLKDSSLTPVSIGSFKLDASKDKSMDGSLRIRGATVSPPAGSTFSQYLRDVLKTELEAAGLYDTASRTVITGTLTTSEIGTTPFDAASGKLGAQFGVTRDGVTRYDRALHVDATWSNAFAGAEAIPVARGQYEVLYKRLIGALFDDPDFRKAISKE